MATGQPNLRFHQAVSALGGAIVNALLQVGFGLLAVRGFTIDWYVHPGRTFFERAFVLEDAFVSGLTVAAGAAAIAAFLGFRAWDKGHIRVGPVDRWDGTPRTRDTHVLLSALFLGLALGAFMIVNLMILYTATRYETLSADAFLLLKASIGVIAGGTASWIVTGTTARFLASGRIQRAPEGENLIAALALASSRKPNRVIAVVLLLALVLAAGIPRIDTNVDVADVLPRGNPNTDAAHNLTEKFKSSFTQQVTLHFRINPDQYAADAAKFMPNRRSAAAPDNITDELYLRAIEQAVAFYVSQEPFRHHVAAPDFYSLVNWTVAGGQSAPDSAFRLPGTDPQGSSQFVTVEQGVRRTIVFSSLDAVVSPDWEQTSALILTSPKEELSSKSIGERALEVRDEYVAWAEANPDEAYQVFTGENAPIFTVDLPVANAHSSELTGEDFTLLLPIISYFIIICLFLAFRHPSYILVAFSSLVLSTVATFGMMGYLDIKMNTLNLTTVPLIMGVGIDYGIHMINEFQANRAKGMSSAEAFRMAGGHGAFALFVGTVTTVIGLAVMVMSPSLLIAQLGILSIIAIVSCYLLAVTFVPAAITLTAPKSAGTKKYKENRWVPAFARHVGRHRVVWSAVLVVMGLAAAASSTALVNEPFGDPARNYLPSDPIREEHEDALRGFYDLPEPDVKANVLVFEGDMTDPAVHRYMDAVEASLRDQPLVISDTLRTLPFLMRTWLTVKDGGGSVAEFTLRERLYEGSGNAEADPYPKSSDEIREEFDNVFQSPLGGFGSLFVDYPDAEIGIMVFSVRADTYDEAAQVWDQVWAAVDENAGARPAGLQVAFVGNTATNYLFVAEEVPWLGYMSAVVTIAVFLLVLGFTRSLRLATLVGLANFATSLFWLGMLPPMGIGLAITLTLPLVFIFCMGSDYVLHLGMACEHAKHGHGDISSAYGSYGKSVFYSFLTTIGAFVIFTQISNVAVRKTMIATSAAILMIFFVTLVLVPLFYPPKDEEAPARTVPVEEPGPVTRPVPQVTVVEAE